MVNIDWELYSWLVRGSQRKAIIEALEKPKIPSQIRNDTKLSIANVSKILKLFVDNGIAECLNPNTKMGKLYKLTPKGQALREELIRKEA
ncbi:MAG: ArsR family transcriptional regulator [Candidatus Aenigmarchaeota archaeon]|nr:ArsR family transcriptional regulator [Candidatus Aenigmarchaeota archaeon]